MKRVGEVSFGPLASARLPSERLPSVLLPSVHRKSPLKKSLSILPIIRSTPLDKILSLAPPCSCSHCRHGCTMGSGMLAKEDFAPMAEFLGVSGSQLREQFLETVELFGKEHFRPKILRKEGKPYGQCIFFSGDGKCKVHPAKPLQCRVAMGCKPYGEELMLWFQENYLVDWKDKQSIREFEGYVGAGGKALPNKKIEKKKERISPKRS